MHTNNPKITVAGLALSLGSAITHIAVGTAFYAPNGSETALRAEIARFPITSGSNQALRHILIGATFTDTDPNGKTLVGKAVAEFSCGISPTKRNFVLTERISGIQPSKIVKMTSPLTVFNFSCPAN